MINHKIHGPPKNPGTLKANGLLVDNYLREYFTKYLPLYGFHVTSAFRTEEESARIPGAAPDSAHGYNLARDFVILDKEGQMITEDLASKIHNEFFTDWQGYTYFSPSQSKDDPLGEKTWHIHVNLPREWTNRTRWIGLLITAGVGAFIIMKIWNSKQFINFRNSLKKE